MKNNRGVGKPDILFYLNSLFLMFELCKMVLWLIMCLLDDFDPQKIEVLKVMRDITSFAIKQEYFKN